MASPPGTSPITVDPTPGTSGQPESTPASEAVRVGAVSFVNTLPLIDGLDGCRELTLRPSVPSLLVDALLGGEVDVALCSSIDYQQAADPLRIVPVGCLGCDGPTLTVRLYAQRPIEELDRIHADTDSHTSVVLLQVLRREMGLPEAALVPYHAREHVAESRPVAWPDAMLLIGDKVVIDSPLAVRYPYQLDLGEAWHRLTGLPFTFATWMARADADPARVALAAAILDRQRRKNAPLRERLVHDRVVPRGWPADLAREYLVERIRYELTPRAIEGLERFHALAHAHGLVPRHRPLAFHGRD